MSAGHSTNKRLAIDEQPTTQQPAYKGRLDELIAMLERNPPAIERVHKYMRGELPAMTQNVMPLRLAAAMLERLDKLVDHYSSDPKFINDGRLTRARMLEKVITRGCESLEQEGAQKPEHAALHHKASQE